MSLLVIPVWRSPSQRWKAPHSRSCSSVFMLIVNPPSTRRGRLVLSPRSTPATPFVSARIFVFSAEPLSRFG